MTKLTTNPRAGLGRGKPAKPSPATTLGTLALLMTGTLQADKLVVTGASGAVGKKMSDRMAGKRPVTNPSTNKMAEDSANDAVTKKNESSLSIPDIALEENDPREMLKTTQQGTKYYFTHVDELLEVMGKQFEV